MSENRTVSPNTTLLSKSIPLRHYSMPQDEITKILGRLQSAVSNFGDIEVTAHLQASGIAPSELAERKAEILPNSFRVTTSITGAENETVLANSVEDVFNANTPRRVTKIFATNRTAYRSFTGREPIQSFDLNLDFRSSPILDTNPVSDPTLNESYFYIQGDENWVSSIEEAVLGVLRNYRNNRAALHGPFVYDLGIFLVAIPLALIASYFAQPYVDDLFGAAHGVVYAASYIYLFYVVLLLYRFAFGYIRWLFPVVDLERTKSPNKRHRGVWVWIALAVIAAWVGFLVVPS